MNRCKYILIQLTVTYVIFGKVIFNHYADWNIYSWNLIYYFWNSGKDILLGFCIRSLLTNSTVRSIVLCLILSFIASCIWNILYFMNKNIAECGLTIFCMWCIEISLMLLTVALTFKLKWLN